ncbi:MAG: hypothetical protein CVU97_04910 [Firmicutes bacterium HGW-Firmicutes-21]|nr:MAG: hypothetical protein CVU97_04910 [Firmicutes bacterium HGW-Firmicutes-21]
MLNFFIKNTPLSYYFATSSKIARKGALNKRLDDLRIKMLQRDARYVPQADDLTVCFSFDRQLPVRPTLNAHIFTLLITFYTQKSILSIYNINKFPE